MWKFRLYRWRKRILLPIAMMPLLQMTGTSCNLDEQTGATIVTLVANTLRQSILQDLPSADVVQLLLGNPPPLFTGKPIRR